ncbi:MAG: hypothetical protein ACTHNW_16485 [Mucilaginibacter sp.]
MSILYKELRSTHNLLQANSRLPGRGSINKIQQIAIKLSRIFFVIN